MLCILCRVMIVRMYWFVGDVCIFVNVLCFSIGGGLVVLVGIENSGRDLLDWSVEEEDI